MRKGKTVIGQDVFSLADGRRVHSVKDLVVSEDHDTIVALLVDEGGLLGTSTIVPIEAVHRFGPDAVMVQDSSAVIPASADDRVAATLDRNVTLLGTPVVTTEGERVGQIGDMYFDEDTGEILGYEVSGGTLGDVMRGTSWLPLTAIEVVGPDAIIATPEAAEIVESQVGGVQAALDDARETAASTGQDLGDRLQATVADTQGTLAEATQPDPIADDPDGQLVGRRATTDVIDGTGSVVVANGQRVTLDHVQRARDEGGLDALYAAVGLERPVPVSEQLSAAAKSASETASDLWSRFTTRLSEMTDSAGRRLDAEQTKGQLDRIHDAIGRPVTKVFLDRDDNVILDLGDLVTHQAVQRAYDAGQLDQLLASVYKAPEITFTREEMKAPVPGDSTIEQASGGASVVDELETKVTEAEAPTEAAEAPTDQTGAATPDEAPAPDDARRRRRAKGRSGTTDQAGTPVPDDATADADEAAIGAAVGIDDGPPELPERTGDRAQG
jgi:uncharacterized protein YrrD